jgi:hypothetical protein
MLLLPVKADSSTKRATLNAIVEDLVRSFELQSLAWPVVEFVLDHLNLLMRQCGQVSALGDILANQTIGVFIAPPLPATTLLRSSQTHHSANLN